MASPNLSEALTTTLRNRSKKLTDNITDSNAALKRMSERGNIRPVDGGRDIVEELEYAENGTAAWYSGYDVLSVAPQDVFTAAVYDLKQFAVAVTISGLEQLQNSGSSQIINLMSARIKNAERTARNYIGAGIYAAGTGSGGKEIGGLQLLVADTATSGTVGGIDRATWSFWQNKSFDASTDGGTAATSSNIQTYMNQLYVQLVIGNDGPDLILADNNYWRLYLESLTAIQRITNEKMASAGFANLKFQQADVVLDGGIGGSCPTNHMYMLNTNYIHYRPHKDRNMVPIGGERMSVNQDAIVEILGWAGNMTLSNARMQGVLKA